MKLPEVPHLWTAQIQLLPATPMPAVRQSRLIYLSSYIISPFSYVESKINDFAFEVFMLVKKLI
jgi:hypothetical protein